MAPEYDINSDGDFHIAQHRDDPLKDAKIETEWTQEKDDEIYAPWEELVAAMLGDDITKHVDVSSHQQTGSVESEKAAENLVEEIDEIETREHAEALLATLRDKDIIEEDGDEVVLFRDVSGEADNPYALYNWAAAMELARVKIEDQIERAKKLDEQLQDDLDDITDIGRDFVEEDPQEQINRLDQKFNALGDGEGVPDPEKLDPNERREYNQYLQSLQIARSRKRIQEQYTIEEGEGTDIKTMQGEIENFQHLHQAFSEYEKQLRTMIRANKWRHNNVGDMLDGLIDMIGGITMLDQAMGDMGPEEIEDTLNELTEPKDQAYNAGSEITEDIEDEEVEQAVEGKDEEEFRDSFNR